MPSDSGKPTIIYPCLWDYRVIMTTKDTSMLKELLETYQRPFKLELKTLLKTLNFIVLMFLWKFQMKKNGTRFFKKLHN